MSFFSSFSSSSSEANLTTAKTILSTAATVAATAMLIRSVANEFLPIELHDYIITKITTVFSRFSTDLTMVIEEFEGLDNNQIYEAAQTYLGTVISPSTQRLRLSKSDHQQTFTLSMERNQPVTDFFNGVKLNWLLISRRVENYHHNNITASLKSEIRSLELTFNRKHKKMILENYIPFIIREAKSKKQEMKTLRIFTIDYQNLYGSLNDAWIGTSLDHPTTFETLALDRDLREFVMEDLERFVKRKDYYRKVGKAWKRGYLLYGPPGTGKSSLIGAMANYLHFDIYDLELSELSSNSELRRLLIAMPNRSIVVVEDIDCTVEFQDRNGRSRNGRSNDRQVTLSGLLNFIDGLWSSCGDERIIVFTTNHKEKLDPALLRPGRMDVHIHMSYCTPYGFRQLAFRYLGIKEHTLFGEIEETIQKIMVTPAEVAEQLLKGSDTETTLNDLSDFLRKKKVSQEFEAKKREQEEQQRNDQLVDDNDNEEENAELI